MPVTPTLAPDCVTLFRRPVLCRPTRGFAYMDHRNRRQPPSGRFIQRPQIRRSEQLRSHSDDSEVTIDRQRLRDTLNSLESFLGE